MRRLKGAIIVLIDILQVPRNLIFCLAHGLRLDSTWRLYGLPWIRRGGHGSILTIGRRFKACSRIGRNSLGIFQPVIIRTVSHGAHLEIGDDVGVSGCTISAAERIVIGNRVLIGSGALITDSDAHAINPEIRLKKGVGGLTRPVIIEDDVFIGARAIVLKGVTIGRGSVVGAGAVVSRNVPPYSIVAGNPIKIIGDSRKAKR